MLNVVSFTYMHPDMINRAAQLLQLGPGAVDQLTDRYVLMSKVSNPSAHDVVIHEIPYEDFTTGKTDWALEYLQKLEQTTPKDLFDKVFPRNVDNIRRKVINTIYFAMDKVYKCETLLITFADSIKLSLEKQQVPNVIYTSLQEEFEIATDYTSGFEHHVIIKKRSDKNGRGTG